MGCSPSRFLTAVPSAAGAVAPNDRVAHGPSEKSNFSSPTSVISSASSRKGSSPTRNGQATDFHDLYILGERLGRGAFAQVHVAVKISHGESQIARAVKVVDTRLASRKMNKMLEMEVDIWKKVGKYAHCVRLLDVHFSSSLCYMVMERCFSDLLEYLESIPDLTERFLGLIFVQMLRAIQHVHGKRVVHRDIKPDNFMVGGEDGNTIKLSDFGLATPMPKDGPLSGEVGTPMFMCPEMLLGRPYTEKADMWSFAVVVYCLLFGRFPLKISAHGGSAGKKKILLEQDERLSFKGKCTYRAVAFVMILLNRSPEARPSASDALKLSYLADALEKERQLQDVLPNLRSVLQHAKEAKVFDGANTEQKNHGIDDLLNTLQLERHGKPIPGTGVGEEHKTGQSRTSNQPVPLKNSLQTSLSHDVTASVVMSDDLNDDASSSCTV